MRRAYYLSCNFHAWHKTSDPSRDLFYDLVSSGGSGLQVARVLVSLGPCQASKLEHHVMRSDRTPSIPVG